MDPYTDPDDDLAEPAALRYWSIRELPSGARHLVGSVLIRGRYSARVTSALKALDLAARTATSERGREYILVGFRGGTLDADTAWWHYASKLGLEPGRDVTNQLIDSLQDESCVAGLRPTRAGSGRRNCCWLSRWMLSGWKHFHSPRPRNSPHEVSARMGAT